MTLGLDISVNCTGICLNDGTNFQLFRLVSGKDNSCEWHTDIQYQKCGTNSGIWEKAISTIDFSTQLYKLLAPYKDTIKKVNIESTALTLRGFGKSSSVIDLAIYATAAYRVIHKLGFKPNLIGANRIKKVFTGNAKAKKEEMIAKFRSLHPNMYTDGVDRKIDDVVDAYALTTM